MTLKFKIEQIAIAPRNPNEARKLLEDMGLKDWVEDNVSATGYVFGRPGKNSAELQFNYTAFEGKEFEILKYQIGKNWLDQADNKDYRNDTPASPHRNASKFSHIGMHCSPEELTQWRLFFAQREIRVAQEVVTTDHTNPFLKENGRKYNYVIFDTLDVLGVYVKFIVRIEKASA